MVAENDVRIIKTGCNMCLNRCGINVYTKNGKVVKVTPMQEHPINRLCVKAAAIPELVHSSERLTDPLRKVNGTWKRIAWDEAFDFVASRLADIKQKHGPESVIAHIGQPFVYTYTERVLRRFIELYGSPNYTTGASFCYLARVIAHSLTVGSHVLPHYSENTSKCLVIWGFNPVESDPAWTGDIYALLRKGARLIVVDPKATPLAKRADIHAQIRPGTDCALALGLLNVIIDENLYDKDFVEKWTAGFDLLAEHVKEYPPEKVEEITWIKADMIRSMARMYASARPAAIAHGISLDHCTNGIQAIRAVTVLMAITGNIDVAGGNVFPFRLRKTSFRLDKQMAEKRSVGADYPLFTRYTHEETVVPAIDAMFTQKPYPIKGLLIVGCNPLLTWPNVNKVKKGFEKLELLLVVDIFMTETAQMADIVLPGTTFLERAEVRDYGFDFPLITLADRVINPIGNSMEDWKIWAELGKRMGYGDYFPWEDSDELLGYWLKATNISLDQLRQNPGGVNYAERQFQRYIKEGFNTPSGKVEIYSKILEENGYDPLPTYHEPAESPVSCPDLAERYPLIFVSGSRTVAYLHSEFRNLPSLRRLVPEPLLEIHPETASGLGVADGDMVTVESIRGSIKLKAKLTEDIHPKVVTMQHGWNGANANLLTDDHSRDPISGYPGFRSVLCRLMRA